MIGNPFPLKANAKKSFIGSYVLGMGFVLTIEEAQALIAKDPRNKEVLFPYLNGDDLNNHPEQKASRWVINFFDWSEEKARTYPDCFEIIERLVKPERQRWSIDKNGNEMIGIYALRKPLPQKWWIYSEKRPALYETISQLDQVMVINRHAKYLLISIIKKGIVYSEATVVLAFDRYEHFCILSSVLHDVWAWKNSSTMGASTLRYSTSNALETFPFPLFDSDLIEEMGAMIDQLRKRIMTKANVGLTETYNLFHNPKLQVSHELYTDILELRKLHSDLDKVVLEAYGWNDIQLEHNFYEMEYLPENDRIRYSIELAVRQEILQRLLVLNHERHSRETSEKIASKKMSESSDPHNLFTNSANN